MISGMSKEAFQGFITLNGERIDYSVVRSKRRLRTIAFAFGRGADLRVLAPWVASPASIEKILYKRAPWILRERQLRKRDDGKPEYSDGATFSFLGHPCVLKVTQGQGAASCRLAPYALHVHVAEENLSPEDLQHEVRLEILLWVKKRARTKLKKRLDFWAKRLGVKYSKFILANPEQRWGSCSPDNTIRLNWRLMMAPLPILDYVAAHELCHVRHKNHSARYWAFLAAAMPDYRERRKVLRGLERHLPTV